MRQACFLNEAKNLKHLDVDTSNRIRAALATTSRLFDEARELSLTMGDLEAQVRELYPENADARATLAGLGADARKRRVNSREALATALKVQAQANANFAEDEAVLSELASPQRVGVSGSVIVAGRDSVHEAINDIGQEIAKRNLDVQPTPTVRPGFPVQVIVSKDLVL